jgi:branched-chain amino acid transport system substrate-binding protein
MKIKVMSLVTAAVVALSMSSALTAAANPLAGASKPGSACTKAGSSVKSAAATLKCSKVKGKLVWVAAKKGKKGKDINIGALVPLTGSGATYGPGMLAAIQIAVDEVNKAGGPLNRNLKLFSADDQSDPIAAVPAAEKLVNINKIRTLLGTYSSAVTLAVSPVAISANIIAMNTSGAPSVSAQGPLTFQFNPRENLYAEAELSIAIEKGYKTASILAAANPATKGNADIFTKLFEAAGGKILARVDFVQGQPSYRAELQKVLAPKPDFVLGASYVPDASIYVKEAYSIDPNVRWIGPAFGFNATLAKSLGAQITDGIMGADSVPATDSAAFKSYAKKFKSATGNDAISNTYGAMTYDMVNMYALAVQKAGSDDTQAVANALHLISGNGTGTKVSNFAEGKKALEAGKKIDYQGASGPLKFNKTNNRGVYFGIFELKGGTAILKETIKSTLDPNAS